MEEGRYWVVRDFSRSIFPVTSGPHNRLPLDESRPLWERVALMNWWVIRSDTDARITYPYFDYNDPGDALSRWRVVKLMRGLVRHAGAGVRVPACRALLQLGGWGQDECWDALTEQEKSHLRDGGYTCCTAEDVASTRRKAELTDPRWMWERYRDQDSRRLLTATSNRKLRREFCRLYAVEYSGDDDTGCPSEEPPPATIVRESGEIPLTGTWPQN